jgi:hypothetical protein
MSATFYEHHNAMKNAPEPFTHVEVRKAITLLRRLDHLQKRGAAGTGNHHSEREIAALMWALSDIGVICGHVIEERRNAANVRCVRPPAHSDDCDGRLGYPG